MKKLFLIGLFATIFFAVQAQLTKSERKMVTKHLQSTLKTLQKTVKGLTDEQMNFKPGEGQWSIKECVYHLALSETNLWAWMQGLVAAPANPEKRSEVKMTDEQLIAAIGSRAQKVKTFETFEPKNAKWANVSEAMTFIKTERGKHIAFMKTTDSDFRNHLTSESPMGTIDAFQVVLLMSEHVVRHSKQIQEIKDNAAFPK